MRVTNSVTIAVVMIAGVTIDRMSCTSLTYVWHFLTGVLYQFVLHHHIHHQHAYK